jgi:D-sedoheptulose 7-phosphate isomerase
MLDIVKASISAAAAAAKQLEGDVATLQKIVDAGQLLVKTFRSGGKVYSCGNGGSMCDAMHFAEELSGKFRKERAPIGAMAISDAAHLTCTSNDFGFEHVFSRFIEGHGRKGDCLFAISTSGTSKNIKLAIDSAKKAGMTVISLTGRPKSLVGNLADIDICTEVKTPYSDRIQELHIKVIHTLIELCERELFNEQY